MQPVVTVVVVNWNGAHLLPTCLPALLAQELSGGRTFRAVVVDNASTDDSLSVLAAFPEVRVVRNLENLGFAGGNNSALRAVTTPYVALLNTDAVPEPGWLEALLAPFEAPGGERLAMTTGKVLFAKDFVGLDVATTPYLTPERPDDDRGVRVHRCSVDGSDVRDELGGSTYPRTLRFRWTRASGTVLVPVTGGGPWQVRATVSADEEKDVRFDWPGGGTTLAVPPRPGTELAFDVPADAPRLAAVNNAGVVLLDSGQAADRGLGRQDGPAYAEVREVFGACGNGMAVRSEVGHAVDWFDDAYFLYYEDVDLSWRIRARGWAIRYVPDAVLRHEHMGSSSTVSDLHAFHDARNRFLCLATNATAGLLRRSLAAYVADTARAARRRTATRHELGVRVRALRSFARLLPRALARRREVARTATVSRRALEETAIAKAAWRRGQD